MAEKSHSAEADTTSKPFPAIETNGIRAEMEFRQLQVVGDKLAAIQGSVN